ncbi:transcriptional regulator with XRE-family HTH domain [Paenibacillus amylolyticus]|uniref:Transcriptional regulator with XRE-family HTH domain n=1 Tax=Paenibacillus amylolyticus TaxID=1451 RepID=A0AAP5H1G4_PAEAM|nr:transcriptional regulator [Paenibacillus amylolyticus]MDR6723221.1 transcriptional regulator with XRE-family HTH domain [Paenibacillus amylolyticus]
MNSITTIRDHFEDYLKSKHMTLNSFSELSGINSGTLSSTLSGQRPIGVQQLDRLTEGMGLPEGYFYDLYINECFVNTNPDWRRIGPFLKRCAELGRVECIEATVKLLMDNLSYAPLLFELAEQLYAEGRLEAAKPLYFCVAESEKMQHSERLALSQYRLFSIGLGKDQQKNLSLATQFEFFVDRLDEPYQLDGLNDLINVYASLRRWDKVEILAEQLKVKAIIQYEFKEISRETETRTKKQVIFYVLYAYLALGEVCFNKKEYEEGLEYILLYKDHSWVNDPSDDEIRIIRQFEEWAEGNYYLYQLMSGKTEVLPSYLNYISARENEVFPALCAIVSAANQFEMNIHSILDQFESYFMYREQVSDIGKISEQYTSDQYVNLLADVGTYYLTHRDSSRGIHFILRGLELAITIKNKDGMLSCIKTFEEFRYCASEEDKVKYKNLISGVR